MKKIFFGITVALTLSSWVFCQIPASTQIRILRAEDARRYDSVLENLIKSPNAVIRSRAALAAGRIGDDKAIIDLVAMLADRSTEVRSMAAFAIGEVESIRGADAVLAAIKAETRGPWNMPVLARLVEAAGKIAAANPKDERSKLLGNAILNIVNGQAVSPSPADVLVVRLGLTALLRARPEGTDTVVAKFLNETDPILRADAANTLTRLRAKNANEALRKMLASDADAVARANAARALGAAEDKDAFDILLKAATDDTDSRVRVSAIRALAALRDARAAEPLLKRGEVSFDEYKKAKKPNFIPNVHSEFVEIATTLGRLLPNTRNERAINLFREFGTLDQGHSPEVYIARVRIAPGRGDNSNPKLNDWRQYSTLAQVVGEFSAIEPIDDEGKKMKAEAPGVLRPFAMAFAEADPAVEGKRMLAAPDVLQAYARFKTADLGEVARSALKNKDVQTRATAAGILADLPTSEENVRALKLAWVSASSDDKNENDAQLAILEAVFKIGKKDSGGVLLLGMEHPDYLVRKSALAKFADKELQGYVPTAQGWIKEAHEKRLDQVLPHDPKTRTKLGQVLNTNADYRRALSRKNGTVRAVLTTEKGTFTIDFYPEEAPLTVDNFVKLARSGYFNGLEVHRVVPNFVMQDGDPRGDGNGGPGWSIRCEVNMLPYDRGAVGMALSGKDTGGSQWFVTHSPQPHLDGGYTVFGHVSETDMKVVDNIVRGDKIISVKIIGR